MKKINKNYILLSAYIDGELSPKETARLEEKLSRSIELQTVLAGLKKTKALASSARRIEENPYFETRLNAAIKNYKPSKVFFKKWSPVIGFTVATVILMVFLRFNPSLIENIVEKQKTNLAGFYKENLRPLLYAADISNEDIFNFAFSNKIPLDRNKSQYLQLGYDSSGKEFFEIKKSDGKESGNNLAKFVAALNLNKEEKEQVDSILDGYAEQIELQILLNDKNTIAINPNLWNYNKAIVADLISFAAKNNKPEISKIISSAYMPGLAEARAIINEVKQNKSNKFIFLTPDTVFTEEYAFDSGKFKEQMRKMKEDIKKKGKDTESAQKELDNLNKAFSFNFNIDKTVKNTPNVPGTGNMNVVIRVDSNVCRVHLANVDIPEIEMPNFNEITEQIVKATRDAKVNMPILPRMNFSFSTVGVEEGDAEQPEPPVVKSSTGISLDSLVQLSTRLKKNNKKQDTSNKSSLKDSVKVDKNEFNQQMKEFKESMERMQLELRKMQENIQKEQAQPKKENQQKTVSGDPLEI